MGAAIGFLVALTLATPAGSPAPARLSSLRPINLSLPAPSPSPAQAQAPKTLAPGFFTTPIPKPPPAPAWVRAMFGDPDHPPSGSGTRTAGGHGGRGFGRGFGGGHGCHGGGHR